MILCLDYGERYVGVAIADLEDRIALRHSTVNQKEDDALSKIKDVVEEEGVEKILVSVPRSLSGEETAQTRVSLGFVATDYAIAVWSLKEARAVDALFDEDMLGDDLEAWMAESTMLKRTFRAVAVIAGLIERRYPGQRKSGRQITFSSDLIYDVLRSHQPDHILLRATRADAGEGLTDLRRLAALLGEVQGRIAHRRLDRISPLAVPILLEVGREGVAGSAHDALLDEAAEDLAREATAPEPQEAMA